MPGLKLLQRVAVALICGAALAASVAHADAHGDHRKESAGYAKRGDAVLALLALREELTDPTGHEVDRAVRELKKVAGFKTALLNQVAAVSGPGVYYENMLTALDLAVRAGLISADERAAAQATITQRYVEAARAGKLEPYLSDNRALWSDAGQDMEFAKLLLRSSLAGRRRSEEEFIAALAFVDDHPQKPALRAWLEAQLPQLQFDLRAIKGAIRSAFPAYANAQIAARVVPVMLNAEGDTPLILALVARLKDTPGLQFEISARPNIARVHLQQGAYAYTPMQPQSQTVVLTKDQVDLGALIVLAIDNSNYVFELRKDVVAYNYAFTLTIARGRAAPTVVNVSDQGQASMTRCYNTRTVDPRGHAMSVGFPASARMRQVCTQDPDLMSREGYQARVIQALDDAIVSALGAER